MVHEQLCLIGGPKRGPNPPHCQNENSSLAYGLKIDQVAGSLQSGGAQLGSTGGRLSGHVGQLLFALSISTTKF